MKDASIRQIVERTKRELAALGFSYLLTHPLTRQTMTLNIWVDKTIAFDAECNFGEGIAYRDATLIANVPLFAHEPLHNRQFLSYEAGLHNQEAKDHALFRKGIYEPSEYAAACIERDVYVRGRQYKGFERLPMSNAAWHAKLGRENFKRWFYTKSSYVQHFKQNMGKNA